MRDRLSAAPLGVSLSFVTSTQSVRVEERELVIRWLPAARLYFVRHGGAADADDLAHHAVLLTLEALRDGKVRDRARVGGFLLGVCRNLASNRARSDARRAAALSRLTPEESASYEPPVDRFKLWRCLNALSARARDVVLRTFVTEEDADAIAARHGMNAGAVRVMRHRSLAALARCVQEGEQR